MVVSEALRYHGASSLSETFVNRVQKTTILIGCLLPLWVFGDSGIDYQHAYGFLAEPRYGKNFRHFDFVNPEAPKGGRIRVPQMGNWDSFNPVSEKGRLGAGLGFWSRDTNLLWDSLLVPALDEPATHYGLLAEGIAVADDQSWVAFKLRDGTYWHDGEPITVDDVLFSYESYQEHGSPAVKTSFEPFIIERINDREFRFLVPPEHRDNPTIPIQLGGILVMPKHYWADKDISKTTVEPPLGSGPYRISKFSVGRWLEFERVENYWARNLAVSIGRYNFDRVKYDYFRDDQVQTEALKGNVVDVHIENVPRTWFESYDMPAVNEGYVKKVEYKLGKPAGLWWPIFWNLDQRRFQDIRVRKAVWLLSDMVWGNQRSYGFWGIAQSFFHDSEFAALGMPNEAELRLLEPLRGQIPDTVFNETFKLQPNRGGGWARENILEADRLLKEAGWIVVDGERVHEETGEPFNIKFIAVSPALGSSFIPLTRLLKRLGITSSIKSPEISNWLYRNQSGDFDASSIWFLPDNTPTLQIRNTFHSSEAGKAYGSNWSNLRDPAVDALIDAIGTATTWEDYVTAIRAFDRVMLHNYYWIPSMSKTIEAVAYWDNYGVPEYDRLLRLAHVDTWWWDDDKAKAVRKFTGDAN